MNDAGLLIPDWRLPSGVQARVTTRFGGVSQSPWSSLNLADHVGDDAGAVSANRHLLRQALPSEPVWLRQVHGTRCIDAASVHDLPEADACFTRRRGQVCAVLTADCLPVLLCDRLGSVVAAAHAGWRGLAGGVIEATVAAMACPAEDLMAWLGPAIGPTAYEVGPEVREAFVQALPAAESCFRAGRSGHWWCDLPGLARLRLSRLGVRDITASGWCTHTDAERFFSFRRDGVTGRMASCIWLD